MSVDTVCTPVIAVQWDDNFMLKGSRTIIA
jgi:hypothetical protein